ncbi:conserved exported hypothetical protein [Burkholderia cepacia]|nr:hypothetical protein DF055_37690 [Burkholderia cepacia]RQZ96100.1 hypothetical protein DF054_37710 [Burkholderia cepacia]CAG9269900.1 conserved exported hypothetical protein [Burkholderia cepacia]
MKGKSFGIVIGLFSVSVYAQFGQMLQSVKDQVTNSAQTQVSQSVRSATNDAMQLAVTHASKMVDSVHSSANSPKGDQISKPHQ